MDNVLAQPYIQVPSVPENWNPPGGKREFAIALLQLLQGAQVVGIEPTGAQPYDIGQLAAQITNIQTDVTNKTFFQRFIKMLAVHNGITTVPFASVPSANYSVDVAFSGTNVNPNDYTWLLIDGSKTTTQCQIRVDSSVSTSCNIEVTITEVKS